MSEETKVEEVKSQDRPMLYNVQAPELGFLFRIRHDTPVVVHVRMKSYVNRDMIQLLKERAGSVQQAKEDFDAYDVKEGSPVAAHEFFDRYKIEVKLNGTVLDDDQINKLDARWNIKNVVIDHGYNGIYSVAVDLESELKKANVLDLLADPVIKCRFLLTDAEEKEHPLIIPFAFEYPGAMDALAWDRAAVQQGLRQGGYRVQYNHEALNTLFGKKIRSAFDEVAKVGMVLADNVPCTFVNKADWVDLVPYLFKRAALSSLFTNAERATRGNG